MCYPAARAELTKILEQMRCTVHFRVGSFLIELAPKSPNRILSSGIGGFVMLLEYIQAALRRAKYEILPDAGSY
jgi:hypothetical protein